MRNYTRKYNKAANLLDSENWNEEALGIAEVLNGQVDLHNLPLKQITTDKIETNAVTVGTVQTDCIGAFNSYYRLKPRNTTLTWAEADGDIFQGWNIIETDYVLSFDAHEGMIKGSAVVCGHKLATYASIGGLNTETGTLSSWELAVFCNDVMIARSGQIPVGVTCVDLPFSTPCGSQPVQIEARWRLYNTYFSGIIFDYPSFSITDRFLWARNEKR